MDETRNPASGVRVHHPREYQQLDDDRGMIEERKKMLRAQAGSSARRVHRERKNQRQSQRPVCFKSQANWGVLCPLERGLRPRQFIKLADRGS